MPKLGAQLGAGEDELHAGFAKGYNGADYRINAYDTKLAKRPASGAALKTTAGHRQPRKHHLSQPLFPKPRHASRRLPPPAYARRKARLLGQADRLHPETFRRRQQ
ncbi:N-acetylmuramidase domain-containing protein [Mesorhizobium sp.]|uniref:N-acetylmuramidase domain-containing protein n=1 Tax=Mesorhizobium sp. TaxID=1871066 RepID=UPI00257F68C1|nr:N-acetylmuramidase domain-containing protein [Mesorhizobium sp.]